MIIWQNLNISGHRRLGSQHQGVRGFPVEMVTDLALKESAKVFFHFFFFLRANSFTKQPCNGFHQKRSSLQKFFFVLVNIDPILPGRLRLYSSSFIRLNNPEGRDYIWLDLLPSQCLEHLRSMVRISWMGTSDLSYDVRQPMPWLQEEGVPGGGQGNPLGKN